MEDFATVAQLEKRWRPLTDAEKVRASVLLGDATQQVLIEATGIVERIEAGKLDPSVPERVVCDMARRAMLAGVDQPAFTNFQETAGPFSQSGTFANPTGDLYLTKTEKRLLGANRQRAFSIDLLDRP